MYSQKIYLIFIDLTFTFCFFKLELERKKKRTTLTAQCWLFFFKVDLFCFLFSNVLYLSNTQTVQAQATGIHRGGCRQRGDFGLMRYHVPSGRENVSLPGVDGNPVMALLGLRWCPVPRQRQMPRLSAFHWLVRCKVKEKVESAFKSDRQCGLAWASSGSVWQWNGTGDGENHESAESLCFCFCSLLYWVSGVGQGV